MKILVITRNAWDDTNSIGNTLSNFFCGIENLEFASLYFRAAKPNNKLCKKYYHTSETELMRKWFCPDSIGNGFEISSDNTTTNSRESGEKKLIGFIRKYGLKLAYKLSDYLWYRKKWINQNLDSFIKDFSPDLMVTFVKSAPQYYLTVKYLREKYNIPLFTWIADDEYTALKQKKREREINNLKYILDESSVVTGCSNEICEYYNSVFGCNAKPLYKSCDLSSPVKDKHGDPITVVYAGNLLYGRLEIISRISEEIEKIALNGVNISFEIYSNTNLTEQEINKVFYNKQHTQYIGKRAYDFIKKRLSEADVALHVESFSEEEMLKTKYSFSTKIIDYLQSGSLILAIGPEELASIKYIDKIPGAHVIKKLDDLNSGLTSLLGASSDFIERKKAIRCFAKEFHDVNVTKKKLEETFNTIVKGGV